MWSMLAASAVFIALAVARATRSAGASSASGSALDVLIAARLALLGVRFAGRRWAVVGWG